MICDYWHYYFLMLLMCLRQTLIIDKKLIVVLFCCLFHTSLPSFITGYNGKPVLINKSGKLKKHANYMEMSINVFMFNYIAKKSLHSLKPKFPTFILNIGFTIEGRSDEELPEVLLGGCRLVKLDLTKVSKLVK